MPKLHALTQTAQIHPLGRAFFGRDPRRVARELLGKILIRQVSRTRLTARIVEVEAYLGENDPAAHSAAGNTARTSVLFGPPGHAYVYFIYGMYDCLNVVVDAPGTPGCVLVRALEPVAGIEIMRSRRQAARKLEDLASGPGKLTLALAITRAHYGADVTRGLLVVREPIDERTVEIGVTPRIGISQCAELPLRFVIKGNKFVSGRGKPLSGTGAN
jgi:DNA-3-methyladenine glycosylase